MPEKTGGSGQAALTLDSDLTELDRLSEFIEGFCDRKSLSEQICYYVSLALEELAVNSITHGHCNPSKAAIRIDLRLESDGLRIAYSDNGVPFNPLESPTPNLAQDLGRRPIGGLGIHVVRCLIPEIQYERRDGRNYLLLTQPIPTEAEPIRQREGAKQGGTDADHDGDRPD